MRRILLPALLACAALCAGGCFNANPDDQTVPWGRPADWERSAPGFGG